MFRFIIAHFFSQEVEQDFTIFGIRHIDKIDYDNTTHITKTQLSCYFGGSNHIHFHGGVFLISGLIRTISAIHVYNMQSFSMFDNKISPFTHGNRFSKGCFDLSLYVVFLKNRCVF
ncbi:hypothetical protein D3C72_1634720 [compost metagenome]